jgi:hypothetical protein
VNHAPARRSRKKPEKVLTYGSIFQSDAGNKVRVPRQSSSTSSSSLPDTAGDCDFGSSPDVNLCGWTNVPISAFEWLPSNGKDSFWIGGPRKDSNGQNEQGEEGIIWHGINYCPLNFEKTAERWCSWSGLWDGPNH